MIILFGLAGSGKSTQGQLLAEKLGYVWLSVGEVIRETGRFGEILKTGKLVDDEIVIELMREKIEAALGRGKNVVLDGFPRNVVQTEWVLKHLVEKIDIAIYLEVNKDELWKRLKLRGREDDTEDAMKQRFMVFEQNIYTMLEMLKAKNIKIGKVDGVGEIEEINQRILEAVRG